MNILMLAPLPPPSGGIASWTVRYIKYCEKKGISLRIVNIAMRGKRAKAETMKRNLKDELFRSINIIHNLRKECKLNRPDIIHINTSCQPVGILRDAACAAFVKQDIPIVLHCRCNIIDQIGENKLSIYALSYLIKRCKKTIVLNSFSKEYVEKICPGKAVFIPNFIDQSALADSHEIHEDIKNVLYVGHVEKAKGFAQILETAEKLPNICFTLVGAVRDSLEGKRLPPNVILANRVSQEVVTSYLSATDVFLFPSLSEGFSNSLLEAMAMGVPIIASDVGANADMIEERGGIILSENTGNEIVEALNKLNDITIRKDMSSWNIDKVKRCYLEKTVMARYFEIYKVVIDTSVIKK